MVSLSGSADAQSGRKTQTRNQTPQPAATPVPEPAPKPEIREPAKPEFSFTVVSNIPQSLYMQFPFPEKMPRWVVERLSSSSLLTVKPGESVNRKQAVELAKSSTETFIVLVELNEDVFANPLPGSTKAGNGNVWIDFYVYTPGSAKIKQKGRAFLKPELLRSRGGVLNRDSLCGANLSREDYLLWEASIEAAERILAGFNLPVPPLKCGARI